jgi:hypothetical protein
MIILTWNSRLIRSPSLLWDSIGSGGNGEEFLLQQIDKVFQHQYE